MSIEDLRDIAAQLHKFAGEGGTQHTAQLCKKPISCLRRPYAQFMNWNLERRVAALER